MASVKISRLAEEDLVEIWKYIADDNPTAATQTVEAIEARFHLLAKQPEMGRNRSELREGLQSHPIDNYIIFFFATKRPKGVEIIRVLEGHRDITSDTLK